MQKWQLEPNKSIKIKLPRTSTFAHILNELILLRGMYAEVSSNA